MEKLNEHYLLPHLLSYLERKDLLNASLSCKKLYRASKSRIVWNAIAARYFNHRGRGSMYLYCKSALSPLDGQLLRQIACLGGLKAHLTPPVLEVLEVEDRTWLAVGNQGEHRLRFFSSEDLNAGPKFELSKRIGPISSASLFRENLLVTYKMGRVELWNRKSREHIILNEGGHGELFGRAEIQPGCSEAGHPEWDSMRRIAHLKQGSQLIANFDAQGRYTVAHHQCNGECHGGRSVSEAPSNTLTWTFDGDCAVMAVMFNLTSLVLHRVEVNKGQVQGFNGIPVGLGSTIQALQSFNACPGAIFVMHGFRNLAKIDVKKGEIAWEIRTPSLVDRMEMAMHAGKPYLVVGGTDQDLSVLDPASGETLLKYEIPDGKSSWRTFTDRGRLRIAIAHNNHRRDDLRLRLLGPHLPEPELDDKPVVEPKRKRHKQRETL